MSADKVGPNAGAQAQYRAATQGIEFTKDFNPALEAMMLDPAASYAQRFLAWLKRRSWGNYCLYAIMDNGEPATQSDAADELNIDKRIISQVVNFYEGRGYLYREGKLMYPYLSPNPAPLSLKVSRSPDFSAFLQDWKVSSSNDFFELEAARSTVERVRKVQLAAYKEWKALRTNGGPSLYKKEEEVEEESSSSPTPPPPEAIHEEEEPPPSIMEPETPIATPEPTAVSTEVLPATPCSWETFKSLYPKERLDWKAKKKFTSMPAKERIHAIGQLIRYMQSERWNDQDGRWIPNASNWLETYEIDPPPLIRLANVKEQKVMADLQFTLKAYTAMYGGKK